MKLALFACLAALPACGSLMAQNRPAVSEDFESGQLDPAVWEKRITGAATIEVQQKEVAHGKYALQVHYSTWRRIRPEYKSRSAAAVW